MEITRIEDLTFCYPNAKTPALKNIDLSIQAAEFIVVCGASGCGKTTLVRNIKKEIAPHGTLTGGIYYKGEHIAKLSPKVSAAEIGFVMQDPENQIVTDTVWHELAFGLENIGVPSTVIRRRVAETAHFFGINEWFEKKVFELSGGQKQILNLAGIMTMQPSLIILDEPTAQLDPIAAKDFLTVLKRIHLELGTTVIITEHRLEDIFPIADKVLFMHQAQVDFFGTTSDFIKSVAEDKQHAFTKAMPSATQIALGLGEQKEHPVTVSQGRAWLKSHIERNGVVGTYDEKSVPVHEKPMLQAKDIWFRYNPRDAFVLRGLSFDVYKGKMTTIVGGNGSGKTTMLSVLAGLFKPIRGSIKRNGNQKTPAKTNDIVLLTQNPKTMFIHDTVREDLQESVDLLGQRAQAKDPIEVITQKLSIHHLLDSHPYDLSGGEQQKVAIAKLLLLKPEILLMDEPTKGLDVHAKEELAKMLKQRCELGCTVVIVTHDVEFAAKYSDISAMIFNGEVICTEPTKHFFVGNTFYTTSANRISRGMVPHAVTCEDVVEACTVD